MHFVCAFLILCVLGVRLVAIEKVRNYEEIAFIKHMFPNGWWGDASPTPSRFAFGRTDNNVFYHYSYQPVWLQYDVRQILLKAHSCFEISARTALAQFGHFTLKTRVRFQRGGGFDPGCATAPPFQSCF